MDRKPAFALVLAAVLASVIVSPALAQEVGGEVAVGYSDLEEARFDRSYSKGLFLGLGVLPSSRLALVVEAAANSTRDSIFDLRLWSLQMGPRVRLFPARGPVAVHAQFLIGVSRNGERLNVPVPTEPDGQDHWSYQDHLSLQPALGFDVALTRHFALRASVGMPLIAFKSTPCARCEAYTDWGRYLRVSLGIVARSGSGAPSKSGTRSGGSSRSGGR